MLSVIKPYFQKKKYTTLLVMTICVFSMAAYPIYCSLYEGRGLETYERHQHILNRTSNFYNPWQYRILCPLIIEGSFQVYMHTVDKVFPLEKYINLKDHLPDDKQDEKARMLLEQMQHPEFLKYFIIFLSFRLFLNLVIFYLCYVFYSKFVTNKWLILFALTFISLSLGNSVIDSDLIFNTYFDNIVYLATGILIVYRKNPWWIVPITFIGAINRETALLAPFIFFVSQFDYSEFKSFSIKSILSIKFPKTSIWVITAIAGVSYIAVFLFIRWYFGLRPAQEWRVPFGVPMLVLNLFGMIAIKGYLEMLGTFSILPVLAIWKFRQTSFILRLLFVTLVPVWFLMHFMSVPAYQSRLFLVPTLLIFIPMVLEIVDKHFKTMPSPTKITDSI